MMIRWLALVTSACLLAVLAAGCGESGPDLYPVEGTVTYNGGPVEGAYVSFIPQSGEGKDSGGIATGLTDAQGRFSLSTGGRAGTVAGQHKVTVTKAEAGEMRDAPSSTGGSSAEDAQRRAEQMSRGMAPDPTAMRARGPGGGGMGSGQPQDETKSSIPQKYASEQSTDLMVEVKAEGENTIPIELKD